MLDGFERIRGEFVGGERTSTGALSGSIHADQSSSWIPREHLLWVIFSKVLLFLWYGIGQEREAISLLRTSQ
jgi:hypothetical protein